MDVPPPTVSALIPTRNRQAMLLDTIASVLAQTVAAEVIVVDDGSTDGSAAAVAERFPPDRCPVRVIRHDTSAGPARRRNEAAAAAVTPFLFTIDDDCLVPSPRTFEQTLAGFQGQPRVAGVTIPFVNVRQGPDVYYRATAGAGPEVSHMFYGGMVAFRRSAFLAVGGYRPAYFILVEEPDLSVRLLNAGYVVRLGSADPIHHLESPVRNRPELYVRGGAEPGSVPLVQHAHAGAARAAAGGGGGVVLPHRRPTAAARPGGVGVGPRGGGGRARTAAAATRGPRRPPAGPAAAARSAAAGRGRAAAAAPAVMTVRPLVVVGPGGRRARHPTSRRLRYAEDPDRRPGDPGLRRTSDAGFIGPVPKYCRSGAILFAAVGRDGR